MSTEQLVLYGLLALGGLLLVRRFLLIRSLTHYSSGEVAKKIRDHDQIVLLDVRTAAERQRGTIQGSVHLPAHELRLRTGELEKYRDREVICFCATGSRSLSAAALLRKAGFNAANMKDGIAGWKSQDLL